MQTKTLLSDHLPILATVPMDNHNVHILSWNIMGYDDRINDIGVSDTALEKQHGENYRYLEIAKFLKQQQNVDIIVLQEVTHQVMDAILEQQFSQEWTIVRGREKDDEGYDMVALVRKNEYSLSAQAFDYRNKTQSVSLVSKRNNKALDVHNVWTQFSFQPDIHETYYTQLLSQKSTANAVSVVIGDTNSRVLPLKLNAAILPLGTGVVPTPFKSGYQNANNDIILDHPDGAFMSDSKGVIHQVANVKPLMTVDAMLGENKKVSEHYTSYYRPFITLDPKYQALKKTKPYKAFFDLVASIKKANYPDAEFNGLLTVNPEGKIGVSLGFSCSRAGAQYTVLNTELNDNPNISFIGEQALNRDPNGLRFCTSNVKGIKALTETLLESLPTKTRVLMQLDAQIATLNKGRYLLWSSSDKVTRLKGLRNTIAAINNPAEISNALDAWKNTADAKGKTNMAVIQTHRNMFRFGYRLATKTSTEKVLDNIETMVKPN